MPWKIFLSITETNDPGEPFAREAHRIEKRFTMSQNCNGWGRCLVLAHHPHPPLRGTFSILEKEEKPFSRMEKVARRAG